MTKDVPNYGVVGGMPAKIIKYRFSPDMAEAISNTQWWQYSVEELLRLPVEKPEHFVRAFAESGDLKMASYKTFLLSSKHGIFKHLHVSYLRKHFLKIWNC